MHDFLFVTPIQAEGRQTKTETPIDFKMMPKGLQWRLVNLQLLQFPSQIA